MVMQNPTSESFLHLLSPESPQKDSTEEESCGALEAQVLSLSQVVRDSCAEFIKHIHGSHVVRTVLNVLAGCVAPPPGPGKL